MMIFQDIPSLNISFSAYTWDESWILPYESIYSLVHKFSVLNLINLSECKKLFKPENTHEKTITELGGKLSLNKLTEIIGMGSSLDKNMVYKIIHQADREWLFSPYLRTCPICWKLGFHSTFHQVMIVTKCPIHQMDLSIIACKSCGSSEQYENIKYISNRSDGDPYTCTKCGMKLWHPYDDIGDSPRRNLLTITVGQKEILDALYDWLIASAQAAPFGTNLKRWESMAGLLFLPAPIGMAPHQKSIYKLRGHEIPLYRGNIIGLQPPCTVTCSNRRDTIRSVVQHGLKPGIKKLSCIVPAVQTTSHSSMIPESSARMQKMAFRQGFDRYINQYGGTFPRFFWLISTGDVRDRLIKPCGGNPARTVIPRFALGHLPIYFGGEIGKNVLGLIIRTNMPTGSICSWSRCLRTIMFKTNGSLYGYLHLSVIGHFKNVCY